MPLSQQMILAGLLLGATACTTDTRLSLDELQELEHAPRAQTETAPAPIPSAQLRLVEQTAYAVQPGDVLQLTLAGPAGRPASGAEAAAGSPTNPYRESTQRVRVDPSGHIRLPLVGPVQVAGMDLSQVEQAVVNAHVPRLLKEMTVFAELLEARPTTVLVTGPGQLPQQVQLRVNERNAIYALSKAGLKLSEVTGRLKVQPAGADVAQQYDLSSAADIQRALAAPPLQSGDMLFFESAPTSAAFVIGLVNLPGPVQLPAGATTSVMQVIASAGGLQDLGPTEATLWRKLPTGTRVRAKVELGEILAGRLPDVEMRSGDILDVPHTSATRMRAWAAANLGVGPFRVGVNYDPLQQFNIDRAIDDEDGTDGFSGAIRDSLQLGVGNILVPNVTPPAP